MPIVYQFDRQEFINVLEANFSEFEVPAKNAELKIIEQKVEVISEAAGQVFSYQKALDLLETQINFLNFKPINLELTAVEPKIKKEHTGSAVNSLENILAIDSIKLTADSYQQQLNQSEFIKWLEFQFQEGEIVVGFNRQKVSEFLEPIAQKIDIEARDAKFKMVGKRVTEFQASRDGKKLNLEKSFDRLNQRISAGIPGDIELVVEVEPAKVTTADVNDLGIKELIGRGISNFGGSPPNRRHNIGVGVASLNGILIEPGEEFSLLKALGPVNESTGYRRELVIKGNRTIPEYGGGLCQIGTTTFRAVLNAGLPITQRRNHSYRVSYYEPPIGMDATIYNPSPDFKFVNDTGNYILFTARVAGDEVIFEFYGTKDGRIASTTEPVVSNFISPGEPRYIETDELPPGEKKRVEIAHAGAEAHFTYKVIYSSGEVKEQEFYSRYVPWKETWLVGRQPTTPTSTQEISEQVIPPSG